jgi:hypothetical protein
MSTFVTTKDGTKRLLTKSTGKNIILHEGPSFTYQGQLYIYQDEQWVLRPLLVADPFDRRPVRAYYDGQWNLIQSF